MATCLCPVCTALVGLPSNLSREQARKVAEQLPDEVRAILAAQNRVRRRQPLQGDVELVEQAARRCRAGRFRDLPVQ